MKWQGNKINKINFKIEEKGRLETETIRATCTPSIDKYSESICNTKSSNRETSFFDRLYNDKNTRNKRHEDKIKENFPSFRPFLNKYTPNFKKNNFIFKPYETIMQIKNKRLLTPDNVVLTEKFNTIDLNEFKINKNISSLTYTSGKSVNDSFRKNEYISNFNKVNVDNKEEEPDLHSRYRLALASNENLQKVYKENYVRKRTSSIIYDSDDYCTVKTENLINKKTNKGYDPFDNNYKINVRDGSACNKNKENLIVYTPKFIKKIVK